MVGEFYYLCSSLPLLLVYTILAAESLKIQCYSAVSFLVLSAQIVNIYLFYIIRKETPWGLWEAEEERYSISFKPSKLQPHLPCPWRKWCKVCLRWTWDYNNCLFTNCSRWTPFHSCISLLCIFIMFFQFCIKHICHNHIGIRKVFFMNYNLAY